MEENNTKETKNEKNSVQEKKDSRKKDNKADKKSFSSIIGQYKGEFKKIVWPDRKDLVKQTVTVVIVSLMVGAVICCYDYIFAFLFAQIVKLTA